MNKLKTQNLDDKTLNTNGVNPLNDNELNEVAGGAGEIKDVKKKIMCMTYSFCGYYNELTKVMTYYPCSKCHTPMYTQDWNPRWICDCCDNKEFFPVAEVWTKSREQLISDAVG